METKTPKFVQGYWRGKKEESSVKAANTGELWMLYIFLGYGALLLLKAAITFPRTAMALLATIGVSYLIVQGFKAAAARKALQATKHKIVVNEANKSTIIYL